MRSSIYLVLIITFSVLSNSISLLVEHPVRIDCTGSISVTVTDEGGYGVENVRVCLQKRHWKTWDFSVRSVQPKASFGFMMPTGIEYDQIAATWCIL